MQNQLSGWDDNRHFGGRLQSKANNMATMLRADFLWLLGRGRYRRYTDGGAAMLTNAAHAERRRKGKAQRQARRMNRGR